MSYKNLAEIDVLISRFSDKSLPVEEWTHVAHLTVGLWFVCEYGQAETAQKMPNCIYMYNNSVGTKNTDTSGYHETITQFWIWLLDAYWQRVRNKMTFLEACNHLFTSPFSERTAFLKFYSEDLIFSVKARKEYVSPDIQPLNADLIA